MPSRYPVEVRRQVVELARSGTRVAQLAETFGMSEADDLQLVEAGAHRPR